MFDNLFNNKAIKELARILAEQEARRTGKYVLQQMDEKSEGFNEKLRAGIEKVLAEECF